MGTKRGVPYRIIELPRERKQFGRDQVYAGLVIAGLLGVTFLLLWIFMTATVPAGHVGVVDTFGVVESHIKPPGLHFKLPWQSIIAISAKTIDISELQDTPSQEGLTVSLDVSILYHLDSAAVPDLYKTIGPNYGTVYIIPTFRSVVRGITASYDAKSLYTSQRETIAQKIFEGLAPKLAERGILLERVLLRSVSLPDQVKNSIEEKLVAEQDAQRMEFVLQKEVQEAARKTIEAQGIANAQDIIDESLTGSYLTWYWITNLEHHNSVIYVPIGNGGLPLFKNVDEVEWKPTNSTG